MMLRGRPRKLRVKKSITRKRGMAAKRMQRPAQKAAYLGRRRRRRRR